MWADPGRLEAFFTPRRVAIIGASEEGMYPAGVIQNLAAHGFDGEIYPVNPNRETVFGRRCYANVTCTPQPADLAVLVVNRRLVLPALQQCAQAGIRAALIFSAGFAEEGGEGRALQDEMQKQAAESGLTIVGPNCAGLANLANRTVITRLPGTPRAGKISFVSQSGALMMALYGLFADRCLGMNRLLSVGNQAGVTLGEGLRHFAALAETGVIAAFVEGLKDGREFAAGLREALTAGKPVVLVKSGQTHAGQAAAATHTAAVAGSGRVFSAVCRQFGALLVDDLQDMLDVEQVLDAFGERITGAGRLGVVTQSGGMGSLTADWCERWGLPMPPFSDALQNRLAELPHLKNLGRLGNPADVRGTSWRGAATAQTLEPFMADEHTGALLLLLARSAVQAQDAETAEQIIRTAQRFEKPLAVVWVGQRQPLEGAETPLAHRLLVEAGIPLFDQPGSAVRALARARNYWFYRREALEHQETEAFCNV